MRRQLNNFGEYVMNKYFVIPSNYALNLNGSISRTDIPSVLSAYYGCANRDEVFAKYGRDAEEKYTAVKFLNNPISFRQKRDAAAYAAANNMTLAYISHGYTKHIKF